MAGALIRIVAIALAMMAALQIVPASAQNFSEGYQFLKAVKERDGTVATEALNEPGTTVVNARDIATGETALHIVVQRRDILWVKFLTQKGANPNIADKQGVMPLQLASSLGFIEGVEALIEAGARVDVTNIAGETPLIAAVHRRDKEMVRLLLANGANVDRADNSGRSARDYARLMGAGSTMLSEIERAESGDKDDVKATYGPDFQ